MANTMLDAALAYAKRGWPVFPVNRQKKPLIPKEEGGQGVLDATTDPARVTAWWTRWPDANIGLDVGGAGLMVIDGDVYKPDFDAAVWNTFPDTQLMQKSPRGGEHLLYELAKGEIVAPSASKLGKGIDVRSYHSYILLAPSVTDDGAYEWISEGKPAFRTDEMVRLANVAKEKHEDRDTWLIEADMPEHVWRAITWLEGKAKIARQGEGGDATAYATAAYLKSLGISEAKALELMWEHWNPRCEPPWSGDEYEHFEAKVRNGYSYNTSPPGNMTDAYHAAKRKVNFQSVVRPVSEELGGVEAINGRFRFIDGDGIDSIRAPEWLIPDLLPVGGYGMLVGPPGTFKSFLALDMALTIASGGNHPWSSPLADGVWAGAQAGKVLFCLGEGRPAFRTRIQAWEKYQLAGARDARKNFILGDPVPSPREEDFERFLQGAIDMSPDGYKLVVIDTVGRSLQGMNENSQEDASAFTALVEAIQRRLNSAVLAIHHTGHDEERARGSSVFKADADTLLIVSRTKGELAVTLTMDKQKDAKEWEAPKLMRLVEVTLSPTEKSLVAAKLPEAQAAAITQRKSHDDAQDATVELILDKAIVAVLSSVKLKEWTQKDLAQAIACRPEIDIGSETLRTHTLTAMREKKTTAARRMYDPLKKRWRYQE